MAELAHWHVATARYPWYPGMRFPVWDHPCARVISRHRFARPNHADLVNWIAAWLAAVRPPVAVLTIADTARVTGKPQPITFDGADAEYVAGFTAAMSDLVRHAHFVHFDVLHDPSLALPNVSLRVSAAPGNQARCALFSCAESHEAWDFGAVDSGVGR